MRLGFDPVRGVLVRVTNGQPGIPIHVFELAGDTWVDRTPASTPAQLSTIEGTRLVWDTAAARLVLTSSGGDGWYAWTGSAWIAIAICGDFTCGAGETAAACPGDCTP